MGCQGVSRNQFSFLSGDVYQLVGVYLDILSRVLSNLLGVLRNFWRELIVRDGCI